MTRSTRISQSLFTKSIAFLFVLSAVLIIHGCGIKGDDSITVNSLDYGESAKYLEANAKLETAQTVDK